MLKPSNLDAALFPSSAFAEAFREGMSRDPKSIPSMYLYDDIGSALFAAICNLREYKCTAGELRILHRHAADIVASFPEQVSLIDLGGGCGKKADPLIEQLESAGSSVSYHNIDVSAASLEAGTRFLRAHANLRCHEHQKDFIGGLKDAVRYRSPDSTVMVLLLGSSIGNFGRLDAVLLIKSIRQQLSSGDFLLLGTDLVKPMHDLIEAYDDPQGVTSAFNKNLLARANYELGTDFNLSKFDHVAVWNEGERCIEMHLVSKEDQLAHLDGGRTAIHFAKEESILTEKSHKYLIPEIGTMGKLVGFKLAAQWIDTQAQFADSLLQAI